MEGGARIIMAGGEPAERAQLRDALAARGISIGNEPPAEVVLALDAAACAAGRAAGAFVVAVVKAKGAKVDALFAAGADDVVVLPAARASQAALIERRLRAASDRAAARAARRCAQALVTIQEVAAEAETWPNLRDVLAAAAGAVGARRAILIVTLDPPWMAEPGEEGAPLLPRAVNPADFPEALAAVSSGEMVLVGEATAPGILAGAHPELADRARTLAGAGVAAAVAVPVRARGRAAGALVFHHHGRVELAEAQVAFTAAVAGLLARSWVSDTPVAGEITDKTVRLEVHRQPVWHPPAAELSPSGAELLETELRKTKEFLEKVIDSTVDAIVAAEPDGTLILFNPGAVRLFGWRAQEVVGRVHVERLYPDGIARQIMRMLRSPAYGGVGRLELTRREVLTKGGELVPVNMTASIIYEGVREVATVGILSDQRDRIRIEQRLVQAQEKLILSEKQALVAELAGAAAHELNQPLTGLTLAAEMLSRRAAGDDPHRQAAQAILNEVARMSEIVKKIGKITHYETKPYVGGANILDLDKASQGDK